MKFCGPKIFFLILAHIILVILLLVLLSNPVIEQLYPRRAHESEIIQVQLDDGALPQFQDHVDPTEDFLSIPAERNEEPTQEQLNQTESESNRTNAIGQTIWKTLKANDFTAEPEWKIEEDYILVTSSYQTSCPISIKIKGQNVPWLKERFLQDITLFMDDRHFNDQEWKRLGHFVPPYGWMALEYSVVQQVVSVLPHVADQQMLLAKKTGETPHCVTCAVVGNGGILNASRMGKEIDSHEYVFRVNGAVIQGYEGDVGRRTSFYGFTAFTMLSSLHILNKRGFSTIPQDKETKYILFTEGQRDYEWLKALQQNKDLSKSALQQYRLHPRDDFGNSFNFKKLLIAHPDFNRYLKNRFLRSKTLYGKYWNLYRPSTGALVLLTALHLCDTVSAYGFMTNDYNEYSDHYYDKTKTPVKLYINHDFLLEKDLWARLHEENIIKLYKGTKGL
ncbi:alpha-N-acetylgalactosaminide alpha-2,6-sialyltransferase 1 [Dendropsophus ebraccatus]|uniref:alpha-N-acetylgalactosaminide alpha-2,6-sialyltransferase 1 n=1 Tax=Dendropsophus ebraccatus TaxID=150705 RepID=UPI003831AF55